MSLFSGSRLATMVNFEKKIRADRLFQSNQPAADMPAEARLKKFESDRGRIINSAAVRRLQQKTQVFPLERNAAVRSRLTHSMEVQQVGRFIVQSIYRELCFEKQQTFGLDGLDRCLESVVEMACLMHDIGNPPFGHFGEQAINDWFKKNLPNSYPAIEDNTHNNCQQLILPPELERDIGCFEGNAQGIRLVHSLLGLNLTFTQIAGILKYTRCGTEFKPEKSSTLSYVKKKVGYYLSERAFVQQLQQTLEMAEGHRHPVSYIMEAADDISYCIADLEDAVEKGIIDLNQLQRQLIVEFNQQLARFGLSGSCPAQSNLPAILDKAKRQADKDRIGPDSHFFISLRVSIIHPLVAHVVKRFIDNIDSVYHGSLNAALLEDQSYAHAITETLKCVARNQVFCHREVEVLELRGYRVITGLLDLYQPLLQLSRHQFSLVMEQANHAPLLETRLFKKIPIKHVRAYQKAVMLEPESALFEQYGTDEMEFYYRCRMIQDYISGMTDQFAFDEYRALMVID